MKIRILFSKLIRFNTLLMLIIVSVVVSVTVSLYSFHETKKQAADLAHTAVVLLEDDVQGLYDCAVSEEANDLFYADYRQLARIKAGVKDCVYLYCFVPREDDALYVFNVYTEKEIASGIGYGEEEDLGYHEKWSNLGCAHEIYKTGKAVDKAEISLFFANDYGNLISYYAPLYDENGELKLIVGVDFAFKDFFVMILFMMGLIIISISVCIILLSRRQLKMVDQRIADPLLLIEEKTQAFAGSEHKGDYQEYLLPENKLSPIELNTLSLSINKMIRDIENYIQNLENITAERERIGTELSLAASIQANSLPSILLLFPALREIDLFASMDPAKEVGGDFYDFFMTDENHLVLVIADVSGKGVPAALFMMISKVLIKTQAGMGLDTAQILTNVNRQLMESNGDNMFVTAWIGILDLRTGHIEAANAGHEYPAIKRAGGRFELLKEQHGLAMGVFDLSIFISYEIELDPGDSIFIYTDGVPEATNAENELFGTDRMLAALNQQPDCDAKTRLELVRSAIDDFVKDADQFDDLTMLSFNFLEKKCEQ